MKFWKSLVCVVAFTACNGEKQEESELAVRSVPPLMVLPSTDDVPEAMRGEKVHPLGDYAYAGSLTYHVTSCKWEGEMATIEFTVKNGGTLPVVVPSPIVASIRPAGIYVDNTPRVPFERNYLNPGITRSAKLKFEIPRIGHYVLVCSESDDAKESAIFDCPVSKRAWIDALDEKNVKADEGQVGNAIPEVSVSATEKSSIASDRSLTQPTSQPIRDSVEEDRHYEPISIEEAMGIKKRKADPIPESSKENAPESTEKQMPTRPRRIWKSADGKFSLDAVIVARSGDSATLLTPDGAKRTIDLRRLCKEDQVYAKGNQWIRLKLPAIAQQSTE